MKITNKTSILLMIGLWMMTSVACDDNNDWAAGPKPAADNAGVYFAKDSKYVFEMPADRNMQLTQDYFVVTMGRDANKAASALQVPIVVRSAQTNLNIPQTVEFEAGSTTAELRIKLNDFELATPYSFSVEVDAKYGNPYSTKNGSTRLDAKVEVLCVLGDATFTPTDYSGTTKPEFVPFVHRIYDNLDGTYTIKNFLFNNAGYDFVFSIDEGNNIRPDAAYGWHDDEELRWYFYSAPNSASASRIPCYLPGKNPDDNVTYIYFYTAENSSSYQAFWIDVNTGKGRMMGYSRYTVSSSGRIAFNIAW